MNLERIQLLPWQILVGLIQGLVEWLPISSEGNAVFFLYNFSTASKSEVLDLVIWLHLGTALAVIAKYPRDIIEVLTLKDKKLFRYLLVATLCTAITGIPLYLFLKESFTSLQGEAINIFVGCLLLVTAIVLYIPTRQKTDEETVETVEVSNKKAALTGLVQGFAVLPGLSRSGVTVSALLMQRVEKEKALKFSFLMSVPAVLGILALQIVSGASLPSSVGIVDLALIEVIVFVTGLMSMEFLLRLAQRIKFWKLCIFLAAVSILFGIPAFL